MRTASRPACDRRWPRRSSSRARAPTPRPKRRSRACTRPRSRPRSRRCRKRVRNTPLSENGFIGAAAGAALVGARPIVDVTIASFLYVAMDQLISIVSKATYMYGGQARVPIVIRAAMFYGGNNAAQHSDRPHPIFMNMPGFKIIAPSTPGDMKGLLKSAVRDDDPVLSFEDGTLWASKGPVPDDGDYLVPLGQAEVKRAGTDVTVVAIAGTVPHALAAAAELEADGVSVE